MFLKFLQSVIPTIQYDIAGEIIFDEWLLKRKRKLKIQWIVFCSMFLMYVVSSIRYSHNIKFKLWINGDCLEFKKKPFIYEQREQSKDIEDMINKIIEIN